MTKISGIQFYVKQVAKEVVFASLGNSLLIKKRIRAIHAKNHLTILNLHRVAEDDSSCYRPLNPKIFKQLIEFLKSHYQITSFLEIKENRNNFLLKSNKPKVILSFDDGYKDFIKVVHPILMKEGIRANQNIIPKCVETGTPPLNVAINDFLGKTDKKEWSQLEIPGYNWDDRLNKLQEGIRLSGFIKNKTKEIQNELEYLIKKQLGERLEELSTPMMNQKDILKILEYYDWGAHSYDHANMREESETFFTKDLENCKNWFKNMLNIDPFIYAFPNGSYRPEQLQIAKRLGFTNLLLVDDDFSSLGNECHLRFGFEANSMKEMRVKATGFVRKIII